MKNKPELYSMKSLTKWFKRDGDETPFCPLYEIVKMIVENKSITTMWGEKIEIGHFEISKDDNTYVYFRPFNGDGYTLYYHYDSRCFSLKNAHFKNIYDINNLISVYNYLSDLNFDVNHLLDEDLAIEKPIDLTIQPNPPKLGLSDDDMAKFEVYFNKLSSEEILRLIDYPHFKNDIVEILEKEISKTKINGN